MPWIRADDHGRAVPLDHAAALTHGLDGRTDFQGNALLKSRENACTAKPHAVDHRSKAAPAPGVAAGEPDSWPGVGGFAADASSLRVRILGPSAVIATVCSKCAARDSSTEEIDQSSSWT